MKKNKPKFRSKAEATFQKTLDRLGVEAYYETTRIRYLVVKWYIPDWVVIEPGSTYKSKFYLELKGYFTPQDRAKLLAVQELNPGIDIRLVFMQDNKIHPKSSTRYSTWCEQHGFKYTIGLENLPTEWLKELGITTDTTRNGSGKKKKTKRQKSG